MASNSRYQLLLLLVQAMTIFVMGQSPRGDDLDSLIDYVFTSPPPGKDIEMGCECVPYYLCENNTIITDGAGAIDIRFKDEACPNFLEVCCQDPLLQPITPEPTELPQGCGRRNPEGVGFRITGGFDGESQFGEFPWMVAILNVEEEDTPEGPHSRFVYQCGGSLIHPNVVLTTAHCVAGAMWISGHGSSGCWPRSCQRSLWPGVTSEGLSWPLEEVAAERRENLHCLNGKFILFLKNTAANKEVTT
ncbi:hypothetical protein J437_LFUL018347 [Ladona fulva]|uniref:Uncharacterized protein n=1 Tax=Ladona fulva TaxID=123851 RepID=A0A8K0KRD1_LADFU|nr:hypothetical protein J437_LFUL018347 [Ladona fulva]